MARTMFFIDGFNIYHSLNVYDPGTKSLKYRKYLWLDYSGLAQRFVRKTDTLAGIYYFSAYATWKPHSMKRHRALVDALKSRGVNVVMGKFKEKDMHCKVCNASFKVREEKMTDVNIAIYLFREALADSFDTGVILSNDTDLVPAIGAVKSVFPNKKIGVLFPLGRWAAELKQACHFWRKIEIVDIVRSQLPDQVQLPNGIVLTRPPEWT
ncbi:MAG: NYN domain-containing protein [Deltaproteobacteria bacterium]|nr:NYN domain-containing protein [Deltaproteobacteria bacterium]